VGFGFGVGADDLGLGFDAVTSLMKCEVRRGRGMQRYTLRNRQALAQHRAINKLARKTNHIERFNNTLRQRVSRLMREALSFSKKLVNHIGAIKLVICHYNLTRVAA